MIERALQEVDELTVIIYNAPETTPIPLHIRAGWIRKLYPQVTVIEAVDGPMEVGDTPEIRSRHEEYIIDRLGISGITHFYSSEFYGDHMSRALGAIDRRIDSDRLAVPISGTMIRSDPWRHRHYIDPVVYRDLVVNIVFLGAPATGKTTLARELAAIHDTVWMPEYGREYWEAHQVDRRLTPEQLVEIAEGHLEREEEMLCDAREYLFTDTNAITTWMFSFYYHGMALPRLSDLADSARSRYDLWFLCDIDIPYDDTWDRSGEASRCEFQEQIVLDLHSRQIPYVRLRGDLESRVRQVSDVLGRYRKW